MAFSLGAITSKLTMDSSGFVRGILNAQALSQTFGQTFATFITNPVLGGIAALTNFGKGAIKSAGQLLSMSESMQRLSNNTGVATDTIQAFVKQNELAGSQAEIAERAVRNFALRLGQAAAGSQQLAAAFQSLGIQAKSVNDVDAAFRQVVQSIFQLDTAQSRIALAAQLFGEEAGPNLLKVLAEFDGSIDDVVKLMTKFGVVTGRDVIDTLAGLNTVAGKTKLVMEGIKQTAITEFLAGFGIEVGTAGQSLADLAETINAKVGPAARDAGENIGNLIGNLDDTVTKLEKILDIIIKIIDASASTGNFISSNLDKFAQFQEGVVDDTAIFLTNRSRISGHDVFGNQLTRSGQ